MAKGRREPWGKVALGYVNDLVVERLTNEPQESIGNFKAIDWGNENEPEARALYCWRREATVNQVGFLPHCEEEFSQWVGGSPDGLIDDDGGVEIKCPFNSKNHVDYALNGTVPRDYEHQIQGLLWVTGRSWWDFVSFDPRMPKLARISIIRVQRDEDLIGDFRRRTRLFLKMVESRLSKLEEGKIGDERVAAT